MPEQVVNTPHPFLKRLQSGIASKNTYLCVGLDPDPRKLPSELPQTIEGIDYFLKTVIEYTHDHCIAYKPNIAFFEALGIPGLTLLQRLKKEIPSDVPVILDGKRGDIGNTSAMQAAFIFEHLDMDASTLHPYMGHDSLTPFFNYKDKYHFVLALTSNPGAQDFETELLATDKPLYERVIDKCSEWHAHTHNVGLVVGATQKDLPIVRSLNPDLLFLIPGVGAQGGSYLDAHTQGKDSQGLVLINSSRGILYTDPSSSYKDSIQKAAMEFIIPS